MGQSEHFVQFYEDDGFLMDSVSSFLGAGLKAGDGPWSSPPSPIGKRWSSDFRRPV